MIAGEVSAPVQAGVFTALIGMASLFVRQVYVYSGAGFRVASSNQQRMETLEKQVAALIADNDLQHKQKHDANNRLTRALYAVEMAAELTARAVTALDGCDCDDLEAVKASMHPIVQILTKLHTDATAAVPQN